MTLVLMFRRCLWHMGDSCKNDGQSSLFILIIATKENYSHNLYHPSQFPPTVPLIAFPPLAGKEPSETHPLIHQPFPISQKWKVNKLKKSKPFPSVKTHFGFLLFPQFLIQSTASSNLWQTPPNVASDHVESYICRVIHKTFDLLVSNIQLHNCREWLELKISWRQTFFIHRQATSRPQHWALSIISSPELWAEEEWEEEWVDEEPWWGRRRPSVSTEQNILNFTSVLLSPGGLEYTQGTIWEWCFEK